MTPEKPPLVEGMARCIDNEGISLELNAIVYVREIPNMPGHCIILASHSLPLVGYHLDRFVLLSDED